MVFSISRNGTYIIRSSVYTLKNTLRTDRKAGDTCTYCQELYYTNSESKYSSHNDFQEKVDRDFHNNPLVESDFGKMSRAPNAEKWTKYHSQQRPDIDTWNMNIALMIL